MERFIGEESLRQCVGSLWLRRRPDQSRPASVHPGLPAPCASRLPLKESWSFRSNRKSSCLNDRASEPHPFVHADPLPQVCLAARIRGVAKGSKACSPPQVPLLRCSCHILPDSPSSLLACILLFSAAFNEMSPCVWIERSASRVSGLSPALCRMGFGLRVLGSVEGGVQSCLSPRPSISGCFLAGTMLEDFCAVSLLSQFSAVSSSRQEPRT